MSDLKMIAQVSDIAANYDAAICDIWGVVHNGRKAYEKACTALIEFRRSRGPVLLLSNAPRPCEDVIRQLAGFGVPRESFDAVLTSGDATRAELASRATGPEPLAVFHIGPERDHPLIDELPVKSVPIEEAKLVLCSGLFDDDSEAPEDYRETLATCLARGLLMICANPDLMVERGTKLVYCAGALAEAYEGIGGQVIYFGKPHTPIYNHAFARLAQIRGKPVAQRRILAIGDGLRTDVKGANAVGLDVLLVTAGLHVAEFGSDPDHPDPKQIAFVLQNLGLNVTAVMARLQ